MLNKAYRRKQKEIWRRRSRREIPIQEKPKRKKPQRQREDGKGDDGVGAKFPLAKTCMDLFSIRSGRRAFHTGRSQSGSTGGLYSSENAGMSSENYVGIIMAENLRFPGEGSSAQG